MPFQVQEESCTGDLYSLTMSKAQHTDFHCTITMQ